MAQRRLPTRRVWVEVGYTIDFKDYEGTRFKVGCEEATDMPLRLYVKAQLPDLRQAIETMAKKLIPDDSFIKRGGIANWLLEFGEEA